MFGRKEHGVHAWLTMLFLLQELFCFIINIVFQILQYFMNIVLNLKSRENCYAFFFRGTGA